jgi:adenylate cyclase
MALKNDIKTKVKNIVDEDLDIIDVPYVPKIGDPKLKTSNTGLLFEATTVYIEMRGSTKVLNNHNRSTVAKIRSTYLEVICDIANENNGCVTNFTENSALIFFHGASKETLSNAVLTAMKIKFMLANEQQGIKPLIKKYIDIDFGIGIDHGKNLCTRINISSNQNLGLFWIGNAIDRATMIGRECKGPNHIGISHHVHENLKDYPKYIIRKNYSGYDEKVNMWDRTKFIYNDNYEYYYHSDGSLSID